MNSLIKTAYGDVYETDVPDDGAIFEYYAVVEKKQFSIIMRGVYGRYRVYERKREKVRLFYDRQGINHIGTYAYESGKGFLGGSRAADNHPYGGGLHNHVSLEEIKI